MCVQCWYSTERTSWNNGRHFEQRWRVVDSSCNTQVDMRHRHQTFSVRRTGDEYSVVSTAWSTDEAAKFSGQNIHHKRVTNDPHRICFHLQMQTTQIYLVNYLLWPHQSRWSTCAAIGYSRTFSHRRNHPRLVQSLQTILETVHGTCIHCVMIQTVPSVD